MTKRSKALRAKMPPEAPARAHEVARNDSEDIDGQPSNNTITEEFIRSLMGCTKGVGDERERFHRDDEER